MGTTADSWTVEGALAVTSTTTLTGAATLSSTLYASGPVTFPGQMFAGVQQTNYLSNYACLLIDAGGLKVGSGWKCQDQATGQYVQLYVYRGAVLYQAI